MTGRDPSPIPSTGQQLRVGSLFSGYGGPIIGV